MMPTRYKAVAFVLASVCLLGGIRSSAHWKQNPPGGVESPKQNTAVQIQKATGKWVKVDSGYRLNFDVLLTASLPPETRVAVKVTRVNHDGTKYEFGSEIPARAELTKGKALTVTVIPPAHHPFSGSYKLQLSIPGRLIKETFVDVKDGARTGVLVPVFKGSLMTLKKPTKPDSVYFMEVTITLSKVLKSDQYINLRLFVVTDPVSGFHDFVDFRIDGDGGTKYPKNIRIGSNIPVKGTYAYIYGADERGQFTMVHSSATIPQ